MKIYIKYKMSIRESYINWIEKGGKKNLIIFFNFIENVEDFINIASKNNNIENIYISPTLDNKYFKINKVLLYDNKKIVKGIPYYFIADFTNKEGMKSSKLTINPGQNAIIFDHFKFFLNQKFRSVLESIMVYNYSIEISKNNSWILSENLGNISIYNRSQWIELIQSLPNKTTSNLINDKDVNFRNEFKKYIFGILKFLINEEYIEEFLDEKYMDIWVKSIIHKTYNIIYNYDSLEFDGDSVSKFAFKNYIIDRFPMFTANELSEYSNQYMSRDFQSIFSDDLQLTSWLLCDPLIKDKIKKSKKVKTDILESFTGAIKQIGNMIEDGIGTMVCCNFYKILGDSLPFPQKMAFGISTTQVIQMNEKMGFISYANDEKNEKARFNIPNNKEPAFVIKFIEVDDGSNINKEYTVLFNPSFISYLNKNSIDKEKTDSLLIFFNKYSHIQEYNENKNESKTEAYIAIYNVIYDEYEKIGINQEYAAEQNRKKDIFYQINRIDRTLVNKLKNILGDEDFKRVSFSIDNDLNIIIMFLDVLPTSLAKSGLKSLSYKITNHEVKIEPKNLIVSTFFSKPGNELNPQLGIDKKEYSKYIAVKTFIERNS